MTDDEALMTKEYRTSEIQKWCARTPFVIGIMAIPSAFGFSHSSFSLPAFLCGQGL